jgi:regulation of enolase protein 1 (concanavalin A-like superfamily)
MTARGADIWTTSDQFHFAYKQLSGNGEIKAKVVSLTNTHQWAKAGVMIRETLAANSKHVDMVVQPGAGVAFQRRADTGAASEEIASQASALAPQWVKLTRTGNNLKAEYSSDGSSWTALGSVVYMPMLENVYVGLVLCSHNVNATNTAEFSDVTINGTVSDQWNNQDIGIQSNIPEQLYAVIADSADNSAVVKHHDPASTTLNTWTGWNIPFTAFTGVNPQTIKKLSIGVGDRDNPQLGGAGDLYIDDIRLHLP